MKKESRFKQKKITLTAIIEVVERRRNNSGKQPCFGN